MVFQKQKTPLTYEQVKDLVEWVEPLRTKALIATQYGCAARIGEILKYKHTYRHKEGDSTPGLCRKDVFVKEEYVLFRLFNFKALNIKEKYGIILKKERWLLDPILAYLKTHKDENFFALQESRARYHIRLGIRGWIKARGISFPEEISSHHLRHSRSYHLASVFDLEDYQLQKALGHASFKTTLGYINMNFDDIGKKMLRSTQDKEKL